MGALGRRLGKIFLDAVWKGRVINVALRCKHKETR